MARQQQQPTSAAARRRASASASATASASSSGAHARTDRRFKDQDAAPPIVSEKRLTFFLPDETYRALRLQTGYFQVANAQAPSHDSEAAVDEQGLPETPSALVREAINYWLDQFRPADEQTRSDRDWKQRMNQLKAALERFGTTASAKKRA